MRTLVCGDRHWDKPKIIEIFLDGLYHQYPELTLIEGCADGADKIAEQWGKKHLAEHRLLEFPANWTEYGKRAGPIRNLDMLEEGKPELVLAFHDNLDESKGTAHMVRIATNAKVPVYVVSRHALIPKTPEPQPKLFTEADETFDRKAQS